jgi:hypothetical protein
MTLEEFYRICDSIRPDKHGCLKYPSKTRSGYHRTVEINGRLFKAHRLALERKLGRPIQPGYFVLHHCDWPSCVSPDHLYEASKRKERIRKLIKRPKNQERLENWRNSPESLAHLKRMRDQYRKARGLPPED